MGFNSGFKGLIDLDPQATLSAQLISKKENNDNSIIELVSSKNAIRRIPIKKSYTRNKISISL